MSATTTRTSSRTNSVTPTPSRALRAVLLLVTALGIALGMATTAVYDRPAGSPPDETMCVSVLVATVDVVATAVSDAPGPGAATGALLFVGVVAGICFAVVIGRLRFAELLRALRPPGAPVAIGGIRASASATRTHPLFDSLSVIRI